MLQQHVFAKFTKPIKLKFKARCLKRYQLAFYRASTPRIAPLTFCAASQLIQTEHAVKLKNPSAAPAYAIIMQWLRLNLGQFLGCEWKRAKLMFKKSRKYVKYGVENKTEGSGKTVAQMGDSAN